jgi:hypothetical protein
MEAQFIKKRNSSTHELYKRNTWLEEEKSSRKTSKLEILASKAVVQR